MDENLGDRRQNTPSNNRNVVPIVIGVCVLIVVAVLGICVYLITAGNILPREVSQRLSEIEAALDSFKTSENTNSSEDYESILQDIQDLKDNMGNLVGNQSEKVNERLEELLGKLEEYKPETDNENLDTTPDVGGTGSPEDTGDKNNSTPTQKPDNDTTQKPDTDKPSNTPSSGETNKYIPLSIYTANKKIVGKNFNIYDSFNEETDVVSIHVINGKVWFTSRWDKSTWTEFLGIPENNIKASKNYSVEVTGFSKKVIDVEISHYQTIETYLFVFLMEDGTVEYSGIKNMLTNLTSEGEVPNVSKIHSINTISTTHKDQANMSIYLGSASTVLALDHQNNSYDIRAIINGNYTVNTSNPQASKDFVPLSMYTANKKVVDKDGWSGYDTFKESNGSFEILVNDGKVQILTGMDKAEWARFLLVDESDIKVPKNTWTDVTGFSKKVVDVEISSYQVIGTYLFVFLMEDGTVEYADFGHIFTNRTSEGKVPNVSRIHSIMDVVAGAEGGDGGINTVVALDDQNNLYDIRAITGQYDIIG